MTDGGVEGEVAGWGKLCCDAGVVQFLPLATDLAGLLELAIAFGPDLGI